MVMREEKLHMYSDLKKQVFVGEEEQEASDPGPTGAQLKRGV